MILTVTLNSCLHHLIAHEDRGDGRVVVPPVRSFFQPGGKGLNAARVIAAMGGDATALCTWGSLEGRIMLREAERGGLKVKGLEVARPTRLSTCVYHLTTGAFSEFLEPGAELSRKEADAFFRLYLDTLPGMRYVALCGSSPCRLADDFFEKAAREARKAGLLVFVDTYGASLVNAVKAGPDLVKVNLQEIQSSFGTTLKGTEDLKRFAARLQDQGVGSVLVTDGANGAWLFRGDESCRILVPEVRVIHAIGSGDAFSGALLLRLERGDSLLEACRWGAAAGSANARRLEICTLDTPLVEDLLPSVRLEPIEEQDHRGI